MNVHPSLSGFVNNHLYISPDVIYADLSRIYKNKSIEYYDIVEWCARVETLHLADIDKMFYFEGDEFEVKDGMVLLPYNMFRLLDVYTDPKNSNSIINKIGNNGSVLYGFNMPDGKKIYLNYIGIPITDTGIPLIIKSHEEACGFFCRCRLFEEDMANGNFNANLWMMWDSKFSNAVTAAKQNYRAFKRSDINNLHKIKGMMIKRIGNTTLRNNLYW